MAYIINFPRNFDNYNLRYIFQQYKEILNNNIDEIIFDLKNCRWMPPTVLVTIVSMYKYLKTKDFSFIDFELPDNTETYHYLNRINFLRALEIEFEEITRHDSTGRFREITNINSHEEVRNTSNDLATIIENQTNVTEILIDEIETCLGEILDNIFHHSYSPIDGFVCAQTFPKSREAEFAICDTGIGIRRSLLKNPENVDIESDAEAIERALELGVTGTVDENAAGLNNSGEGLYFIKEAILSNRGEFSIYSGNGKMNIYNGNINFNDHTFWPGTLISMKIKLNNEFNLYDKIDDEISDVEGLDGFSF